MDRFYYIYNESRTDTNSNFDEENLFKINDQKMSLKTLLWCMKFSSNSEAEIITKESLLRTKNYLDQNFDYDTHRVKEKINQLRNQIDKEDKNNSQEKCNYEKFSCRDYELEKEVEEADELVKTTTTSKKTNYSEKEIIALRKEKERLEEKKLKTEQILFLIRI